jgi:class I fructose-bisphosphate aldolase
LQRLKKIFRDNGKTVIIAMDHGIGLNVLPELTDTEDTLKKIIEGGADAILTTFGIARKYRDVLSKTNVILRLDGGSTQLGKNSTYPRLLYSVEDALRLGAVGVACMGFPGIDHEEENTQNLAQVACACDRFDMPLIAEMLPGGFGDAIPKTIGNVKFATRLGCELGADVIKTTFAGTTDEFKELIRGSFCPVVVLGGDKVNDISDLFSLIENAMTAGAAGVAIGRNAWKHEHPERVTKALVDIVHNGRKAEECLKLVE